MTTDPTGTSKQAPLGRRPGTNRTRQAISSAVEGPEDTVGERLTRAFLDAWEGEPRHSEPLLAMLRGAISVGRTGARRPQRREVIDREQSRGSLCAVVRL